MTIEQAATLAFELEQLSAQQLEVVQSSTSIRMSAEEKIKYDARRERIREICGVLTSCGICSFTNNDPANDPIFSADRPLSRTLCRSVSTRYASS
jgi:hypothetical protein